MPHLKIGGHIPLWHMGPWFAWRFHRYSILKSYPKPVSESTFESHPAPTTSSWSLIQRMLRLGWRYRFACVLVLLLNLLLVGLNLSGLGLTGLGIDILRHALQPGSVLAHWPGNMSPPLEWSPLSVVLAVAALVLGVASIQAVLKYITASVSAALSQRIVIQLRTDVFMTSFKG